MADPKKNAPYFIEKAKLAQRTTELEAFYIQTTILDPVLAVLERQATALEKLAQGMEIWLGNQGLGTGKPSEEPVNEQDFMPEYADDELAAMRERLAQASAVAPNVQQMLKTEKERQWTPGEKT
jgi:hypothetical protein